MAVLALMGALVLGTVLSACAREESMTPELTLSWIGGEDTYFTHCGVGQQEFDGVLWYPTGVYEGDVALEGDGYAGPTPWVLEEGQWGMLPEGDTWTNQHMLTTAGTFERLGDDAAVFHVYGGRWSIALTTHEDDAAWVIEGCA